MLSGFRAFILLILLSCAVIPSVAQVTPQEGNPMSPAPSATAFQISITVSPTVISACGSTLLDVIVTGFPVGNVTFQLSSSNGAVAEPVVQSVAVSSVHRFPKFALPSWPAASSLVTLANSVNSLTVPMFVQPCWSAAAPAAVPVQSSSPIIVYGSGLVPARDYICRFISSTDPSVVMSSVSSAVSSSFFSCPISTALTSGGRYILSVVDSVTSMSVDRDGGIVEINVIERITSAAPVDIDASLPSSVTLTGDGFNIRTVYSCTITTAQGLVLRSTSAVVASSTLVCMFSTWPYDAGPVQLQVVRGDFAIPTLLSLNFFASWTSVSPKTAPVAGGSLITISGSGFVQSVAVQCKFSGFGLISLLSASVYPVSSSIIVCSSPRWTSSTLSANLELVQVSGGQPIPFQSGSSSVFLFVFENWLSLSPISGPVTGRSILTVSGAGFSASASYVCSFEFNNGQSLTSPIANVVSSGQLTCQTPVLVNRPHGIAAFTVRNANNGDTIGNVGSSKQFTFVPVISTYDPSVLSIVSATVISVSGIGFDVNKSYACSFKYASGAAVGSTVAIVSSAVAISCPSPLAIAYQPADAVMAITDGVTESNAVPVTFMPSLLSIYPSVICYNPGASITVYGSGFAANDQYSLVLNFQPVDGNFLQSTFTGSYTLPRSSISIQSSTNSLSSMLVFVLTSGAVPDGAVDIKVSLRSAKDSRTFLNTLDLFPSLNGRSSCAVVSADSGISISASGGSSVTVSVANGVYPKLIGSPNDWLSKGVGLRSFQCIFASRNFFANSSAVITSANASSSNVVPMVIFGCTAPVWLSAATSVRIYIKFEALFLPVSFYIGSTNDFSVLESISFVTPSLVPYNGGHRLTVIGNGFSSDGTVYKCHFHNIESSVSVVSSAMLTCLSPVLSLPATLSFSVKYASGAPVLTTGNVAVIFSASILSVSSPEVFINSAAVVLSVGGLQSIDAARHRCVISFINPPVIFELALVANQTTSTSVTCDTSTFATYAATGQIYGGSAIVTLKRVSVADPIINGSVAVTFLGSITSLFPSDSANPSKFITVMGNGFVPGVNTAQVCAFQSASDLFAPVITSTTVGLMYTSSLICNKPNIPSGTYKFFIQAGSQVIARPSFPMSYIATPEWTSISSDKFSAMGGSVFTVIGSSFSLRSKYTVKFSFDSHHYVSAVVVPVSATILTGYSPAWPFPSSQVDVTVEFQGIAISNFRQSVTFFPEISRLQPAAEFSRPFLYFKASGLSPISYTCHITDVRTGSLVQTRGTLRNATSLLPYGMRPMFLNSTDKQFFFDRFTILFRSVLSSEASNAYSPPFSPDFLTSVQDWVLKDFRFNILKSKIPTVFQSEVDRKPPTSLEQSHWFEDFQFTTPNNDAMSYLRLTVQFSTPTILTAENSAAFDFSEGIMIRCDFAIESEGKFYSSSHTVLLQPLFPVECSHSFRETISRVSINVTTCSSCRFRVDNAIVEKWRLTPYSIPSSFMFGTQDIGCSDSNLALVAPLDSLGSSLFREWISLCVINNTFTSDGGAIAAIAKVNVSSVNRQHEVNATVSYRVLYDVTPQSFLPDVRWMASSTNSSVSFILRKLWLLAEPVTAAGVNPTAYLGNAPISDLSNIMPSVVASFLNFESTKFSSLDSSAVACDASSVTEGQKTVVVSPSTQSHFALDRVSLSVRVIPTLSVMSMTISATGNSKFLFKIDGLDSTFDYQLICSFRSSFSSKVYSSFVSSQNGFDEMSSLFSCLTPAVDGVGASWTFGVSSSTANFSLVAPSQILVRDQLLMNATDVDSAVGRSVPVSFASNLLESLVCNFSAPLSFTPRSLELVGGAWATIPAPLMNSRQFSISLWIRASAAIKDDVWTDVLSALNFFSISISRSVVNSTKIKFCVPVSYGAVSTEKCVISSGLSILNVWTHIFAGVDGSFGDIVLAVNDQRPYYSLKLPQFNLIVNVSNVIVLGQTLPFSDSVPYDGLIDNVRLFSEFLSPKFVSELYQRTFSSYPPVNMIMSLTFDDDEGRDEVSGLKITPHKLPIFLSLKGQWFSSCIHFASGSTFSYPTLYVNGTTFVSRLSDSSEPFVSRFFFHSNFQFVFSI
jgi:hypothetical protein